ncbi:hypothetical protein, partial [Alicyclobacillus acidoterrestris]
VPSNKASNAASEVPSNKASNVASVQVETSQTSGTTNIAEVLRRPQKVEKRYRGFYLMPEVDDALNAIKSEYGRGVLSDLVNAILTDGLNAHGLLVRKTSE